MTEHEFEREYPEPELDTDLESEPESDLERWPTVESFPESGAERFESFEAFRDAVDGFAQEEEDVLLAQEIAREKKERERSGSALSWFRSKAKYVSALVLASVLAGAAARKESSQVEEMGARAQGESELVQKLEAMQDKVTETEIRELAAGSLQAAMSTFDTWKSEPFAQSVLVDFAADDPQFLSQYLDDMKGESYAPAIAEQILLQDPSFAVYKAERPPHAEDSEWEEQQAIHEAMVQALQTSEHPDAAVIREIQARDLDYRTASKLYPIASYAREHALTVDQAIEIASDDHKYWDIQIDLLVSGTPAQQQEAEQFLGNHAEERIEFMNYGYKQKTDTGRFDAVKGASSLELYTTLLYGGDRGYVSTNGALFDMLHRQMKAEGLTPTQLLEQVDPLPNHEFMRVAAEGKRLDDFLALEESPEAQKRIVAEILSDIEAGDTIEKLGSAAQTIERTKRFPEIKQMLQEQLRGEYEQAVADGSREAQTAYGLLSDLYGDEATWLGDRAEEFEVKVERELKTAELFNERGESVQEYFFYSDEDGHWSFLHFVDDAREDGYKLTDNKTFITLEKEQDGRKVVMYANKPFAGLAGEMKDMIRSEADMRQVLDSWGSGPGIADVPADVWEQGMPSGVEDMRTAMEEADRVPLVQVHRGHTGSNVVTLEHVRPTTKLYIDGSCGGAGDIDRALRVAPDAQVVFNTATGRTVVNDAIIDSVNKSIISGKDIDWARVRADVGKAIGEQFTELEDRTEAIYDSNQYVFPDEVESKVAILETRYRQLTEVDLDSVLGRQIDSPGPLASR